MVGAAVAGESKPRLTAIIERVSGVDELRIVDAQRLRHGAGDGGGDEPEATRRKELVRRCGDVHPVELETSVADVQDGVVARVVDELEDPLNRLDELLCPLRTLAIRCLVGHRRLCEL